MTFFEYDLSTLVEENHALRKVEDLIPWAQYLKRMESQERYCGREGYGLEVGIRCLFLQFFYDLSDRQLEDNLRHNTAYRWFCNLPFDRDTPDHSFFCRFRKKLGTKNTASLFQSLVEGAKELEIIRGLYTFIDASSIKRKESTWEERDQALEAGEEKLNNNNIEKYAADKDARYGCKGNKKFWHGYKRHTAVDMSSGLIVKTAVTPANITDSAGLALVCPRETIVYADKGYATNFVFDTLEERGCGNSVILKNNMHGKNRDRDRWISSVRMPCENVFSKLSKRVRYCGWVKAHAQNFMESFVYNVKRLLKLESPPLPV